MESISSRKEKVFQLLKRGFIELISVFVAILLALWVDELYEDYQRQQRIGLAMQSVMSEMKDNHKLLLKAHDFQTKTLSIIRDKFSKNEDVTEVQAEELLAKMYQRSMFHPARLIDTAWQVMLQSQLLNYMPHETVLKYAHHYKAQQDMMERQKLILQNLDNYRINSENYSQMLYLYNHSVNEIWWSEKNLLASFSNLGVSADNSNK
ncbi:hypothetical protein [Pleionea sediminis]|uniref:hypothetical protein n=1 Tax=Pleionea sediminis TaxID=2569479 RepID=UPI001184F9DA|nr:hypothetical protein [Pleionea sediminis]